MTPREKADRAKSILSESIFKQVMLDIREDLVRKLETLPMGDVETQHIVALELQILRAIPMRLERYIADLQKDEHDAQQTSYMERMRQRIA